VTQFSPTASLIRRCVLVGTAVFLPSFPLGASTPAAGPSQVKPPKSEETIFFTVEAGHHSVLGRCDAEGACKSYLSPFGQGWQSYPDPSLDGDDLAACSAPDGSQFALVTSRSGGVNIWLISADGRSYEALTQDDAGIMPASGVTKDSLAFSPDGKTLAYIDRGNLWVISLADLQTRSLTFDGGVRALCWAPSGEALAVVQNNSLERVAANGSSNVTVVDGDCTQPLVAWSKDPQEPNDMFFWGRGAEQVDDAMDTDLLMPSTVQPNSLALLPTGVALLAPSSSNAQTEVFVAPFTGNDGPTQVTQGGASAVWASPGGRTLYFLRDQVLWRCDLDGSKAKPLGAVPMAHINLGALAPLPGACR
jgi:WD40 repeat protein